MFTESNIEVVTKEEEILNRKLSQEMEKNKHFINRIEQEGSLLNDYILELGSNKKLSFIPDLEKKQVLMRVGYDSEDLKAKELSLHTNAIYQAGDKLKANNTNFAGYLKSLSDSKEEWQIKLLSNILNEHSTHSDRNRVLVREIDGQVRGILSDHYRRLDTSSLYGSFLSASNNLGLRVYRAYANELNSWIEVINPFITPISE
jgi:hypothetical protein